MKPRKPAGRVWCGNLLQIDPMLKGYGLKNLKVLHAWLGRAIAWAEANERKTR